MNDEIREILDFIYNEDNYSNFIDAIYGGKNYYILLSIEEQKKLKDYITNLQKENEHKDKLIDIANAGISNLQEEVRKKEAMYDSLAVDYRLAQEENERLKKTLNCKEYFSSTMPEDTEFVILTKNNYDRQQKDIQLELIDYKLRVEKAVEYIKENATSNYFDSKINMFRREIDLLNILQNGDNSDE